MTRRIALPLLSSTIIGFSLSGCVSQHTYDTARTEAAHLTRALEATHAENQALEQEIATLKLRNKQEDAALSEVRAAIRQETDAAPMFRQRADDKLAALQTQVAYMMNQNRLLGREMAEAKQERVSLQALVAQHKQEVEDATRSVLSPPAFPAAPQSAANHRITPSVPTPTPSVPTPTPPTATAPVPAPAPPSIPAKTPVGPPAKATPAQTEESWTGMIKTWASSLWEWIFG
jgi:hypothetical protein